MQIEMKTNNPSVDYSSSTPGLKSHATHHTQPQAEVERLKAEVLAAQEKAAEVQRDAAEAAAAAAATAGADLAAKERLDAEMEELRTALTAAEGASAGASATVEAEVSRLKEVVATLESEVVDKTRVAEAAEETAASLMERVEKLEALKVYDVPILPPLISSPRCATPLV